VAGSDFRIPPQLRKTLAGTNVIESAFSRIVASLGFRSVDGALRTIQGYEAMNKIRKGQIRWLAKGDVVEQVRFINQTFGIAA
jgi:hypothetical protein